MKHVMRAKLVVSAVARYPNDGTPITNETVAMHAVAKSEGYDGTGADEDNTFARFTPCADFTINIANPALLGKFQPGQKFYADFTEADGKFYGAGEEKA